MGSKFKYTSERNVQIVIALLKAHGIHRVIASPGTTNMTFVVSVENDPWFQVWSSVDERSAAYLLAITSTRGNHKVGHLIDQQIDRRNIPNDIAMESVTIPMVKDYEDERYCEIEANKAILALKLNGGGPAHINMYTKYSKDFSVKELPAAHAIFRHTAFEDKLPDIPQNGRIIISVGAHANFSDRLTNAVDRFCATYDAAVLCDHTSGYRGKYEVHYQLACGQKQWKSPLAKANLCIHIGEVSGNSFTIRATHTWRVSPDGQLRDTFGNLRRVFMMPEEVFFERYASDNASHTEYRDALLEEVESMKPKLPELPFSNIWMAQHMVDKLPARCELHLGIYHSLRSWNFFKLPSGIQAKCNVGGFGIDGGVSTMMGASFAHHEKLFIGVFGDLAFFYDMNVVGNRHVGNNVRLLLINNGKGNEFRNYDHPCYFLGEEADRFVAAAGHYGNKSRCLVKDYATNLGYEYLSASNKEEFNAVVDRFLTPEQTEKPMLLEVFTETEDESQALEQTLNIITDSKYMMKQKVKQIIKDFIGDKNAEVAKKIMKK